MDLDRMQKAALFIAILGGELVAINVLIGNMVYYRINLWFSIPALIIGNLLGIWALISEIKIYIHKGRRK